MKKNLTLLIFVITISFTPVELFSQDDSRIVNVQFLRMKEMPDNGSGDIRDSLIAIYNDNVVKKNEHVLSHREYAHFFTGDSRDYIIIEEYKDLEGMQASFLKTTELENKAWPDEMKRNAFFDMLELYFDNWHGDHLYRTNPRLSKN